MSSTSHRSKDRRAPASRSSYSAVQRLTLCHAQRNECWQHSSVLIPRVVICNERKAQLAGLLYEPDEALGDMWRAQQTSCRRTCSARSAAGVIGPIQDFPETSKAALRASSLSPPPARSPPTLASSSTTSLASSWNIHARTRTAHTQSDCTPRLHSVGGGGSRPDRPGAPTNPSSNPSQPSSRHAVDYPLSCSTVHRGTLAPAREARVVDS